MVPKQAFAPPCHLTTIRAISGQLILALVTKEVEKKSSCDSVFYDSVFYQDSALLDDVFDCVAVATKLVDQMLPPATG